MALMMDTDSRQILTELLGAAALAVGLAVLTHFLFAL